MVGDGAVGLSAQPVPVYPQGFQRGGVKGLHRSVGQSHEDHSLGIGGGVDGKAGAVIHLPHRHRHAGQGVHLIELVGGVDDQIIIPALGDGNRATHRAGAVPVAQLGCPAEHGVLRRNGRFVRHNAVGGIASPEGAPVRGDTRSMAAFGRLFHGDGYLPLLRVGGEAAGHAYIAPACDHIGVGQRVHQCERAVTLRPDTRLRPSVVHAYQRVPDSISAAVRHAERGRHRFLLVQRQLIVAPLGGGWHLPADRCDRDALAVLLTVQRNLYRHRVRLYARLAVHAQRVPLAVHIQLIAFALGLQRHGDALRAAGNGGAVLRYTSVKARRLSACCLIGDGHICTLCRQGKPRFIGQRGRPIYGDDVVLIEGHALSIAGSPNGQRLRSVPGFQEVGQILPHSRCRLGFDGIPRLHGGECIALRLRPAVQAAAVICQRKSVCMLRIRRDGETHLIVALYFRALGGQIQAVQRVRRVRCLRVHSQSLRRGKASCGVIPRLLVRHIGVALTRHQREPVEAASLLRCADLRMGAVEHMHRHVAVMPHRHVHSRHPLYRQRIRPAPSAAADRYNDLRALRVHRQRHSSTGLRCLSVDRDRVTRCEGRGYYDQLIRRNGQLIRLPLRRKADALRHALHRHLQRRQRRRPHHGHIEPLVGGVAAPGVLRLHPHGISRVGGRQKLCQRCSHALPRHTGLDPLRTVDVGVIPHRPHGGGAVCTALRQIAARHTVEIAAADRVRHIVYGGVTATSLGGVGIALQLAGRPVQDGRLQPLLPGGDSQRGDGLAVNAHHSVCLQRHGAPRAAVPGFHPERILARRQLHRLPGLKDALRAVGVFNRDGIPRQRAAVQVGHRQHRRHLVRADDLLFIGGHLLPQRLCQRSVVRRTGGKPALRCGIFRLRVPPHRCVCPVIVRHSAHHIAVARHVLYLRVREHERARLCCGFFQIIAAGAVEPAVICHHAVNGRDEPVRALRERVPLHPGEHLPYRFPLGAVHILRRDDHTAGGAHRHGHAPFSCRQRGGHAGCRHHQRQQE